MPHHDKYAYIGMPSSVNIICVFTFHIMIATESYVAGSADLDDLMVFH